MDYYRFIEPPSFILGAERLAGSTTLVEIGDHRTLPCSVESNPPLNTTWYKNAVPIQSSDR